MSSVVIIDIADSIDHESVREKLVKEIVAIIDNNGWTQQETADFLGIDQPKVSRLKRGIIHGFSMGKLMVFLSKIGCKIQISLTY